MNERIVPKSPKHADDIELAEFRVLVRVDKTERKRPTMEQLTLKLADGPWHMEGVRNVEVQYIGSCDECLCIQKVDPIGRET